VDATAKFVLVWEFAGGVVLCRANRGIQLVQVIVRPFDKFEAQRGHDLVERLCRCLFS